MSPWAAAGVKKEGMKLEKKQKKQQNTKVQVRRNTEPLAPLFSNPGFADSRLRCRFSLFSFFALLWENLRLSVLDFQPPPQATFPSSLFLPPLFFPPSPAGEEIRRCVGFFLTMWVLVPVWSSALPLGPACSPVIFSIWNLQYIISSEDPGTRRSTAFFFFRLPFF